MSDYLDFLDRKIHQGADSGFEPTFMPASLFDFQQAMAANAVRKGRSALHEECGLGKTVQSLVWGQNVIEHTNRPVLYLNPLAVAPQTAVEDSTKCGVASADYLLIFRKRGENRIPVGNPVGFLEYAGDDSKMPADIRRLRGFVGDQKQNRFSHWIWRRYASSIWDDIRMGRVLPYQESKDEDDEKHVHPLQLDVIDRVVQMRSNANETVLTPFMGVGSEVWSAVNAGRKGIGIELKPSYFRQAVRNLQNERADGDFDPSLQDDVFVDSSAGAAAWQSLEEATA
jgi:hypothetical protein